VLAGLLDALNGKARCRNPLGNLRREHFLGVEGHQARYASWVVRQVETGAEADFEHFSVHGLQCLGPFFCEGLPTDAELQQSGENDSCIETAHSNCCRSCIPPPGRGCISLLRSLTQHIEAPRFTLQFVVTRSASRHPSGQTFQVHDLLPPGVIVVHCLDGLGEPFRQ
jgi:hypothetical protein